MFTFVHAADLHLGRRFSTVSEELRDGLKGAHIDAWKALVQLCIAREASFLLIAGDVFENPRPDGRTIGAFIHGVGRLKDADIPVFAIPGNHDPALKGSPFVTGALRDLITFTSPKAATKAVTTHDDTAVEVIGAGFRSSSFSDNPSSSFPKAPKDDTFRIGLLHSSLDIGGTRESRYAPCTRDELAACGYDYWALGHIHKRAVLDGTPIIAFPGCLCGGDVGESGRKGAIVVEVSDGVPTTEFNPLADVLWLNQVVDVGGCTTDNDVRDRIENKVQEEATDASITCARFTLNGRVGSTDLARRLRSPEGLNDLSERFREELDLSLLQFREGDIRRNVDMGSLRDQPHVLGEMLRGIDEARSDPGVLARYGLGATEVNLDAVEAIIAESFMEEIDHAD